MTETAQPHWISIRAEQLRSVLETLRKAAETDTRMANTLEPNMRRSRTFEIQPLGEDLSGYLGFKIVAVPPEGGTRSELIIVVDPRDVTVALIASVEDGPTWFGVQGESGEEEFSPLLAQSPNYFSAEELLQEHFAPMIFGLDQEDVL